MTLHTSINTDWNGEIHKMYNLLDVFLEFK